MENFKMAENKMPGKRKFAKKENKIWVLRVLPPFEFSYHPSVRFCRSVFSLKRQEVILPSSYRSTWLNPALFFGGQKGWMLHQQV